MLGYVTIERGELKVREMDVYQGYYCGICKSTKKQFGNLPRLATNYDSVFLSVLVHNLCGTDFRMEKQFGK